MLPSSPVVRRFILFERSPSSWVTVEIIDPFLNAIKPWPVPIHRTPFLSITIAFGIIPGSAVTGLKSFLIASYLIRPGFSPLGSVPIHMFPSGSQ